ncbi:MAG: hypothetical protein ACE5H4_00775 [Candidatus Thorarchaeota archaeon]
MSVSIVTSGTVSDIEFTPRMLANLRYVLNVFCGVGLTPKRLRLGLGNDSQTIPYVVIDHRTYPGIEAHLFTIADIAVWIPELMSTGDVILYEPFEWHEDCGYDSIEDWRTDAWAMLLGALEGVMEWLGPYLERVAQGMRPDVVWAHDQVEWWTAL